MYTSHLYLLTLSFIASLPLFAVLRAKAPTLTAAPLFLRQIITKTICDAGVTSCRDGYPGCCSVGAACTTDEYHLPVCEGLCNGGPTCSGNMGYCCPLGLTCNYQATMCETDTMILSTMSLTGGPAPKPPSIVAPSNVAPASQAVQPPGETTTAHCCGHKIPGDAG